MSQYSEYEPSGRDPQNHSAGTGRLTLGLAVVATMLVMTFGMPEFTSAQTPSLSQNRPTSISARVSKTVLQVAEPFRLELTVIAPANTKVFFPAVGDQLGEFDVVDHRDIFDIPAVDSTDLRIWTRYVDLESINTGDLEIPSVEIRVGNSSSAGSINSTAIPVRVISVLEDRADPSQFRDIQSVIDVAVPQTNSNDWVLWSVGSFGAVALALASVVLFARRKHLTPAQWALGELEELSKSDSIRIADAESVLWVMSTILRDYAQLQFKISASVQTTEEFLQVVKRGRHIEPQMAVQFGNLLVMADQAKFAGLQLTRNNLETYIEASRALVEMTANNTDPDQEVLLTSSSNQSNTTETR